MVRHAKAQRMLTHDQIWGALDRLAARAGLSPSGLAKRAGLDPTIGRTEHTATYDCAVGTGELGGGDYMLTDAQARWLDGLSELAEEAYDTARAGMPEYK